MSITVTLDDAQARLRVLVGRLTPCDEVVITQDDKAVAKLVVPSPEKPRRKIGTLRGSVLYMAPHVDAPLDDFKEYME